MNGRCQNMEHLTFRKSKRRKIAGVEGGTPNRKIWLLLTPSATVSYLGIRGKYNSVSDPELYKAFYNNKLFFKGKRKWKYSSIQRFPISERMLFFLESSQASPIYPSGKSKVGTSMNKEHWSWDDTDRKTAILGEEHV